MIICRAGERDLRRLSFLFCCAKALMCVEESIPRAVGSDFRPALPLIIVKLSGQISGSNAQARERQEQAQNPVARRRSSLESSGG